MPLPASTPRRLIHQRQVNCNGYQREDGLWDIEGRMTDIKTYDAPNRDRGGLIPAGEPLHDMSIRLTIDLDYVIRDVEAVIDYSPFNICPGIAGQFKRLIGKTIGPGWTRATKEMFAGTQGCTHLMELLGPIATTAFQATHLARSEQIEKHQGKPALLNTCHALAEDGEVVRDFWPEHYQSKK
ncbi:DUF2889 domain-containing protein [Motiliproteus sp. MSK22-1]|uniref:DUF2889 domain-containing protein n=1 Tax=Motiliproteus sp. MSK22-1 TaxID=1897630 RepID=UPI000978A9A0|nr:DUF2889 domain-containing protein [Motiliproteus sp. MSK22-1]OMH32632.1 hypothetical protein BGP75_13860 [Motiliproteus sp. MSK22-1]